MTMKVLLKSIKFACLEKNYAWISFWGILKQAYLLVLYSMKFWSSFICNSIQCLINRQTMTLETYVDLFFISSFIKHFFLRCTPIYFIQMTQMTAHKCHDYLPPMKLFWNPLSLKFLLSSWTERKRSHITYLLAKWPQWPELDWSNARGQDIFQVFQSPCYLGHPQLFFPGL